MNAVREVIGARYVPGLQPLKICRQGSFDMMKYFLLVLSVCVGIVSQVLCAEVPKCRPLPSRNLLRYIRSGIDVIGIVHFTVA